jgi:hypothetical protein
MPICEHCTEIKTYDKLSTCVDRGHITYRCVEKCFNETEKKYIVLKSCIKDIQNKIDAFNKKIKKIKTFINVQDIIDFNVGEICYHLLPCKHNVKIQTNNETHYINYAEGVELYALSSKINFTGFNNDHFNYSVYLNNCEYAKNKYDAFIKDIEQNKYFILYNGSSRGTTDDGYDSYDSDDYASSSYVMLIFDSDNFIFENTQIFKENKECKDNIKKLKEIENKIKSVDINDKDYIEKINQIKEQNNEEKSSCSIM